MFTNQIVELLLAINLYFSLFLLLLCFGVGAIHIFLESIISKFAYGDVPAPLKDTDERLMKYLTKSLIALLISVILLVLILIIKSI
jgi:hypothetical protein